MAKKRTYLIALCIVLLFACAKPAATEPSSTKAVLATQTIPTHTATIEPTETVPPPAATATMQPTKETETLPTSTQAPPTPEPTQAFLITSPAFAQEDAIPVQYTCDGDNISPELEWNAPPLGTKSLVLISDDPDAPGGTWVHWVMFNIPPETSGLSQGIPTNEQLPDGSIQGKNSWPRTGYGGPCPPSGTHRYFFKLYALDTMLTLDASASKKHVTEAMKDHILAKAELMGRYARK